MHDEVKRRLLGLQTTQRRPRDHPPQLGRRLDFTEKGYRRVLLGGDPDEVKLVPPEVVAVREPIGVGDGLGDHGVHGAGLVFGDGSAVQPAGSPPKSHSALAAPKRTTKVAFPSRPERQMTRPRFNRILLKLSGEALMGPASSASTPTPSRRSPARSPRDAVHELCLVVGGGNIFRGMAARGQGLRPGQRRLHGDAGHRHERPRAPGALEKLGAETRVQSAIPMASVSEPYIRRRALRHIEKGRIVLFAAGTGNPYFTTDTAAALRAAEMGCDALFKGTSVDGVYTADPKKVADAKRYETMSFNKVLQRRSEDHGRRCRRALPRQPYSDRRVQHPPARQSRRVLSGRGTATIVQDGE